MSIRNRLAQLKGETLPAPVPPEPPPVGVRTQLDRVRHREHAAGTGDLPIARVVDGYVVERPQGRVFVTETRLDPRHSGAMAPPADFLDQASATLAWLVRNQDLAGIRAEETLFIDLETTGFGGAGIYPFLVGLAFYRNGLLTVQQLFLPGPGHEAALLDYFTEITAPFRYLSSFNGRTFDVHVLEDRCTLHRQRCPVLASPHFDVLFPSRQLWKTSFENCRLTTLERRILGIDRGPDVESGLIPALYHHYVRSGDTHGMAAIFRHNCQDLISLVGLAAALLQSCTGQVPQVGRRRRRHHDEEALSLGLLHLRQGDMHYGIECLHQALSRGGQSRLRGTALRELSLACKRVGHHDRAVDLWQQMVEEFPYEPFAYEELAKWYEHSVRDTGRALAWTVAAAKRFGELPRLKQRLSRLKRRQQVQQLELSPL